MRPWNRSGTCGWILALAILGAVCWVDHASALPEPHSTESVSPIIDDLDASFIDTPIAASRELLSSEASDGECTGVCKHKKLANTHSVKLSHVVPCAEIQAAREEIYDKFDKNPLIPSNAQIVQKVFGCGGSRRSGTDGSSGIDTHVTFQDIAPTGEQTQEQAQEQAQENIYNAHVIAQEAEDESTTSLRRGDDSATSSCAVADFIVEEASLTIEDAQRDVDSIGAKDNVLQAHSKVSAKIQIANTNAEEVPASAFKDLRIPELESMMVGYTPTGDVGTNVNADNSIIQLELIYHVPPGVDIIPASVSGPYTAQWTRVVSSTNTSNADIHLSCSNPGSFAQNTLATTPPAYRKLSLDSRYAGDAYSSGSSAMYQVGASLRHQLGSCDTKHYIPAETKAAIQAVANYDSTTCTQAGCSVRTDQCKLNDSGGYQFGGYANNNPLSHWCKGADHANDKPAQFNRGPGLKRGFDAGYASDDFLQENDAGHHGARSCAPNPFVYGIPTKDSNELLYRRAMCQNKTVTGLSAQRVVDGTVQTDLQRVLGKTLRRSTGYLEVGMDETEYQNRHRQDRSHSIFTQPATAEFLTSGDKCEQVAPIDFAIIDETVKSSCGSTAETGSGHIQIDSDYPAVDNKVYVCMRNSDQVTGLGVDDRFDNITEYFNRGDLVFEAYKTDLNTGGLTTAPSNTNVIPYAVSANGATQVHDGPNGDKEVCFSMTAARIPTCKPNGDCTDSDGDLKTTQDIFGCQVIDSADTIRKTGGPKDYTFPDVGPSSRAATCSISVKDSTNKYAELQIGLDANVTSLINHPVGHPEAGECKYDPSIADPSASLPLKVQSNWALRLRAKCGFQKQVVVRFATWSEFQQVTTSDTNPIYGMPTGVTFKRTATRGAISMLTFNAYTSGVSDHLSNSLVSSSDLPVTLGALTQSATAGIYGKEHTLQQCSRSQTTSSSTYCSAQAVWSDAEKANANFDGMPKFDSKTNTNGHLARQWNDAMNKYVLADTTRMDLTIRETTQCSSGSLNTPSAIESTFFGSKRCSNRVHAGGAQQSDTSEGKNGRAKIQVKYLSATVDMTPTEYACGQEAFYQIDRDNYATLETLRNAHNAGNPSDYHTWSTVVSELVKSIQVQVAQDYSTEMCGDLTYSAFVGIQDTRSCGYTQLELGTSGSPFMTFTVRPAQPTLANHKYFSPIMNLRGNPTGTTHHVGSALTPIDQSDKTGHVKQAYIAFSPVTDASDFTAQGPSDVCTPVSSPWSPGCHANTTANIGNGTANVEHNTCRFSHDDTKSADTVRDMQGDYSFYTSGPRDMDHVASLEVTDLTNLVQTRPLHSGQSENGMFYSQLRGLIETDASQISALSGLEIMNDANSQYSWNPEAVFVASRSFKVSNVDTSSAADREAQATRSDQSVAQQALASLQRIPAISAPPQSQTSNAWITRYSMFGSVDAFAIASGIDEDITQHCVPCSTLKTKASAFMPSNDMTNFETQCKRSRSAMLGVALNDMNDGCPKADSGKTAPWDFNRVVVYNHGLILLTRAFPAFAGRTLWRDTFRVAVSLETYDWINAKTLLTTEDNDPTRVKSRIERRGYDAFTVLPTCPFDAFGLEASPVDTDCTVSWKVDLDGQDGDYVRKTIDEDTHTEDALYMHLDEAPVHYDGVCMLDQTTSTDSAQTINGAATTFKLRKFVSNTDGYPFETEDKTPTRKIIKQCMVGQTPSPCSNDYSCVARSFVASDSHLVRPAGVEDARVTTMHLLTYMDKSFNAQQETLAVGDRCSRWRTDRCVAGDDKKATADTCRLDNASYPASDHMSGANQNMYINQYSATHAPGNSQWVFNNNTMRHAILMHNKCSSGGHQANTLGAYSSNRHTDRSTSVFFPSSHPTAIANATSEFGSLESMRCNAFANQWVDTGFNWTKWDATGYASPVITYSKNYNTESRAMPDCGNQPESLLSYGIQAQMVTETDPRDEYGGGFIAVSTCNVAPRKSLQTPGSGAAQDAETGRKLSRDVRINALFEPNHEINDWTVFSRTSRAADHSLQWRSEDGGSVQTTSTGEDGKIASATDNTMKLFESDEHNSGHFVKPATGSDLSSRTDGMAGSIGGVFDSTVLFGDVRPVNMTVSFTSHGRPVNELVEVYTVLQDTTASSTTTKAKVVTWQWGGSKDDYHKIDLENNAGIPFQSQYSPTMADINALNMTTHPGISECGFSFLHSTHTPGLQSSNLYFDTTGVAGRGGCRRVVFRPRVRNLGFESLTVEMTVTAVDAAGTAETLTKSQTIEVVQVAGQPGMCFAEALLGETGYYSYKNVLGNAMGRHCIGEHTDSNADGMSMADKLHTLVRQSRAGYMPDIYRLPIQATSMTFAGNSNFNTDGSFKLGIGDPGTYNAQPTDFTIPCDYDTTCNMYDERAFLSICASNDIQLLHQTDVVNNGDATHNFTIISPFEKQLSGDALGVQDSLICGWANVSNVSLSAAESATIDELTKVNQYLGNSWTNRDGTLHDDPYPASLPFQTYNSLHQGGRLYRIAVAKTGVVCAHSNNTVCSVGYHYDDAVSDAGYKQPGIDGALQINQLFYSPGSDIELKTDIQIYAFMTTFTRDVTGETEAVMAVSAAGTRSRSQKITWKAQVATHLDTGGVCTDNVQLPYGANGQETVDANYITIARNNDGTAKYVPLKYDEVKNMTGSEIMSRYNTDLTDAHPYMGAGMPIMSTKDFEHNDIDGYFKRFNITVKDSSSNSNMEWINVEITRALVTDSSTQRFANATNVLAGSSIQCPDSPDGRCGDYYTSGQLATTSSRRAKVFVGTSNQIEKVSVDIKKPTGYQKDNVGNDVLICYKLSYVNSLNKVWSPCQEMCVFALDPDAVATTTCSVSSCNNDPLNNPPRDICPASNPTLASGVCSTTLPNDSAKRIASVSRMLSDSRKGVVDIPRAVETRTDGMLLRVDTASESKFSQHKGKSTDLSLASRSNDSGDLMDFAPTLSGHWSDSSKYSNKPVIVSDDGTDPAQVGIKHSTTDMDAMYNDGCGEGSFCRSVFSNVESDIQHYRVQYQLDVNPQNAPVCDESITTGQVVGAVETLADGHTPVHTAHVTDYIGNSNNNGGLLCSVFKTNYATLTSWQAYASPNKPICMKGVGASDGVDCKNTNLLSVEDYSQQEVLKIGAGDADTTTTTGSSGIINTGATTVDACSGPKDQMQDKMMSCTGYPFADDESTYGKAGHYTFSLNKLFEKTYAQGNQKVCTLGDGVKITVSGTTGALQLGEAHVEGYYSDIKQTLKSLLPFPVANEDVLKIVQGATANEFIVKLNCNGDDCLLLKYACELPFTNKVLWHTVKGNFKGDSSDRFLTFAFVPTDVTGRVHLDTDEQALDTVQKWTGMDLSFKLKRYMQTEFVSNVEHVIGQHSDWDYDNSVRKSDDAKALVESRNVWVRVQVCGEELISDSRGFVLTDDSGTAYAMQDSMSEIGARQKLSTQERSGEMCGFKYVQLPAGQMEKPLRLSISRADLLSNTKTCAGCMVRKLHISLCQDDMRKCFIMDRNPSDIDIRLFQRAAESNPSSMSAHDSHNTYSGTGDGSIMCTPNNNALESCGLSFANAFSATNNDPEQVSSCNVDSDKNQMTFSRVATNIEPYTIYMGSALNTTQNYASNNDHELVEIVAAATGTHTYAVFSSHTGMCVGNVDSSDARIAQLNEVSDGDAINKLKCKISSSMYGDLSAPQVCNRIALFTVTNNNAGETTPVYVKVTSRRNLAQATINYLHVVEAACDSATKCTMPSLAPRLAVVQTPTAATNSYGAKTHAIMAQFGMEFGAPSLDDQNRVTLNFQFGNYRANYKGATGAARSGCFEDSSYGVNSYDGIGYNVYSDNVHNQCLDWGEPDDRGKHHRGFSPAIMMIGVGNTMDSIETVSSDSKVFDRHFTDDGYCSPTRLIGNKLDYNVRDMATSLFQDKLEGVIDGSEYKTRAQCTVFGSQVDSPRPNMNTIFNEQLAFSYMKDALPNQPTWTWSTERDTGTGSDVMNSANTCGSREKVNGVFTASLDAVSNCKGFYKDSNDQTRWGSVTKSSVQESPTDGEISVVEYPICMHRLSSTMPRGSNSEAILREESACVDVSVYVKTTNSYTSTEVNLGRTTDLPGIYTESVDLTPETPQKQTVELQGLTLVDPVCWAQCQTSYMGMSASTCDGSCEAECQIAMYSYEDPATGEYDIIENSFGHIEAQLLVETIIARNETGGNELPYVNNVRSFQDAGVSTVGGPNVHTTSVRNARDDATCRVEVMDDTTHSFVTVTSRRKRIVDVSQSFELKSVKIGTKTGNAWVQTLDTAGRANNIMPRVNAFSEIESTCSNKDSWSPVDPALNFKHPAGAFPRANEYVFQVQTGKCDVVPNNNKCFSPDTVQTSNCVVGEYKTVQVYLDYRVQQQYVNPQEIVYNLQTGLYEGLPSVAYEGNAVSYASLADRNEAVTTAKVTQNEVLTSGQPFELVTEVVGNIGQHFALQQKQAIVVIDSQECDPNDGCPSGYRNGGCGNAIDQSDAISAVHALSKVVAYKHSTTNVQSDGAPSSQDLKTALRNTPWYSGVLKSIRASYPDGLTPGTQEVCFGLTAFDLNNQQVAKSSIQGSIWCPEDHLTGSTFWTGEDEVHSFLAKINQESCSVENSVFACGTTGNKWCRKMLSNADMENVDDADGKKNKVCLGTNINTGTPGDTSSNAFVYFFRAMTVVDKYALRANKIRQNNHVTFGDINDAKCVQTSEVTETTPYSTKFMADDPKCSNLDAMVAHSMELAPKMKKFIDMEQNVAVKADSVESAGRHHQCLASTKSTALTEAESALSHATSSWLRNSILFGSSFSIPCVGRTAFMVSVVTDTRNEAICTRPRISCENNVLSVTGVSQVQSNDGTPALDGTASYKLYRSTEVPRNCHQGAMSSADADCQPRKRNGFALALLEGVEADVCNIGQSNHFIEDNTGAGLRFYSGALELISPETSGANKEDVFTLKSRSGTLLYVRPERNANPPNSGFVPVTCGLGDNVDLVCDASTTKGKHRQSSYESLFQTGVTPPTTAGNTRRLLFRTSSNAGVHELAVPMSSARRLLQAASDITVATSAPLAGGAFTNETCKTRIQSTALTCDVAQRYTYRADWDTVSCSANPAGDGCTHSYCCVPIQTNETHNVYNSVIHHIGGMSDKCSDLGKADTKYMITFISSFVLGLFLTLIILINMTFVAGMAYRYPDSKFGRAHDQMSSLNWRVVTMIMIILVQALALIVAAIGQGSGDWIDKCGMPSDGSWPVWVPIINIVFILARLIYVMGFGIHLGVQITIETLGEMPQRMVLAMRSAFGYPADARTQRFRNRQDGSAGADTANTSNDTATRNSQLMLGTSKSGKSTKTVKSTKTTKTSDKTTKTSDKTTKSSKTSVKLNKMQNLV